MNIAATTPAGPSDFMNNSILVVEDDDELRTTVQKSLTCAGFRVVTARNGVEALAVYTQASPDLVLIDLIMPEKEGIETILELKRRNPEVKIVAMSGGGRFGSTAFLEIARRLGATYTLAKPFSSDELVLMIQSALAGQKPGG